MSVESWKIQGSQEWLEWRRNKITGTDASVIMEVSPFKTPFELYQEKMGIVPEEEATPWMKRGLMLEPQAREWFTKAHYYIEPDVMAANDPYEWMGGSFDGIGVDADGERFVLEIKCPGSEDHELAKRGSVPAKYFPQIQHLISVSGASYAIYLSFVSLTEDIYTITVPKDRPYIMNMISKEYEFWKRLQEFDPPPLIDRDHEKARKKEQQDNTQIRNDEEWTKLVETYLRVKETNQISGRYLDEIKAQLIELSGGLNVKGGGIKLSKSLQKGNIDYRGFIDDLIVEGVLDQDYTIDLLEMRRKPSSEVWRIVEDSACG